MVTQVLVETCSQEQKQIFHNVLRRCENKACVCGTVR
jgi:hypothetical protein